MEKNLYKEVINQHLINLENRLKALEPKIKDIAYKTSTSDAQNYINELYSMVVLQKDIIKFIYNNK